MTCCPKKQCEIRELQDPCQKYEPYPADELLTRFRPATVLVTATFFINNVEYTTRSTGFILKGFVVTTASSVICPSISPNINSSVYPIRLLVTILSPCYPEPVYAQIAALDCKSNMALLVLPDVNMKQLPRFKVFDPCYRPSLYRTGQINVFYIDNIHPFLIDNMKTRILTTGIVSLNHPLMSYTRLQNVPPNKPWVAGSPIYNVYGWLISMYDPTIGLNGYLDYKCFYAMFNQLRCRYRQIQGFTYKIWNYIGISFSNLLSTPDFLYVESSDQLSIPVGSELIRICGQTIDKCKTPNSGMCLGTCNSIGTFLYDSKADRDVEIISRKCLPKITDIIHLIILGTPPIQQQQFNWMVDSIYYDTSDGYKTLRQLYLSLDPNVNNYLDEQINLSRYV